MSEQGQSPLPDARADRAQPKGSGVRAPGPFKVLRVVFRKELLDALRDRRSLFSALVFPLLMPLLFSLMFQALIERETPTARTKLPTIGLRNAPGLVEHLATHGIDAEAAAADLTPNPRAAVEDSRADAILVIPEDYPQQFRRGRPAELELYFDDSRSESRRTARRAQRAILGYSQRIGALRLVARGVSPELLSPIRVEEHDTSTPSKLTAQLLSLIPMLALMACFIGSMQVAIDTTAGERERGSLEPLLINPVSRLGLSAGKWLTASLFGVVSCSLTLLTSLLAMSQVDLAKLGFHFSVGLAQGLRMWFVLVPLCTLASALQMTIATFARSYKEAQTYLSLVLFLPMLPGLLLSLSPMSTKPWMWSVPVLSQTQFLTDIMAGDPPGALGVGLAASATLLLSVLCLSLGARLLNSERIVFGR
ncbi:MAG: ABC transporter permease [Myxococcales bacterium]|nr:ABC transporter permease [Myxococcales bacterium]